MLNNSPVGESDLLLIFFTDRLGKVQVIAKGALRSHKRFMGILLSLNHLELELIPTRVRETGYFLNLASLKKSRFSISQNPERLGAGYALAELIEKSLPELSPEPILYELLESGLDRIQSARNFREELFYYLLRFLEQMGYLPSLDFCSVCGAKLKFEDAHYYFSVRKGGYVCGNCQRKPDKSLREISAGFAKTLKALRRLAPSKPAQIRLLEKDYRFGLELFNDFITWQIGASLKSLVFLKQFE